MANPVYIDLRGCVQGPALSPAQPNAGKVRRVLAETANWREMTAMLGADRVTQPGSLWENTEMAWKRMVLQIGMGTDIRGADYTKAAVRALRDALWHNSLSVADAVGLPVNSMRVEVTIGVPHPEQVDKQAVLAVLPHGTGTVQIVEGGLEIGNDSGTNKTVIANAAAVVRLDVP